MFLLVVTFPIEETKKSGSWPVMDSREIDLFSTWIRSDPCLGKLIHKLMQHCNLIKQLWSAEFLEKRKFNLEIVHNLLSGEF